MKSLRVLKAAGLILTAVVLGLMTVQGTYALWNKVVPSNAGTLQAADFNVLVNGTPMPAAQITQLEIGQLGRGPANAKYTKIEIANKVNVTPDSPLVLQASVAGLTPVDNFGGKLTVRTARVAGTADCKTVAYPVAAPSGPIIVTKDAPQTLCFKVELAADTAAAHMGKPITIPVTVTVAQAPVAQK